MRLPRHGLLSDFSSNCKSRTADTQESSKKERATGSQAETETPRPTKQQKTPQNVDPNFNGNDWVEVYGNESVSPPLKPLPILTPFSKCDRCAKADVCFKPKDRGRKTCWRCSHYKKQCADGRDKQPVTPKPVARASGEKVDTRLGNNIGDRLLQAFETHVAAIDSAMHKTEINIAIVRERLAEIRDDNGQLMGRMATIEDRLNTIKEKCGSDDVGSP